MMSEYYDAIFIPHLDAIAAPENVVTYFKETFAQPDNTLKIGI
jgi:hypothetical protein